MAIGAAKVDITPAYPIHLNGYAVRELESDGFAQRLWAQALAVGSDEEGVSLLLTVDNTGVPAHLTEALFRRLSGKGRLSRENVALCSTHTHHSPMLAGVLPNLFSRELQPEHQARIDRYTAELEELLEEVALAALADRQPAHLSWGLGSVDFAKNRRTPGGPVDHSLPVLSVRSPAGDLRAVFTRYSCHCTTVDRRLNKHHGDWAGEARAAIEEAHPGAIVMIAIGCGGDAGPRPHGTLELARQHGRSLALEVERLLAKRLEPITRLPETRLRRFELPFAPLPGLHEWEERAREEGIVGYHARRNLARLGRGEKLPASLPYHVQAWLFGEELTMVFLPGEVVVDYTRLLQEAVGGERLWINAYANDVPCYIPSRRILDEGGYEAETSMWFYDRPARLAPETEDLIVDAVRTLIHG